MKVARGVTSRTAAPRSGIPKPWHRAGPGALQRSVWLNSTGRPPGSLRGELAPLAALCGRGWGAPRRSATSRGLHLPPAHPAEATVRHRCCTQRLPSDTDAALRGYRQTPMLHLRVSISAQHGPPPGGLGKIRERRGARACDACAWIACRSRAARSRSVSACISSIRACCAPAPASAAAFCSSSSATCSAHVSRR
jgi:hypothetical protein